MHALIEQHQGAIAGLCRQHRVRRLDVFGSAVRGNFDWARSDLDFLVEFETMSPATYADAYFALKDALEALFQRPVDLVTAESVVNPYFEASIAGHSETVYAG